MTPIASTSQPCLRDRHRLGMTLPAVLLTAVATLGMLGGVVVVDQSVRTKEATHQTQRTLHQLNVALALYRDHHEDAPAGNASEVIRTLKTDRQCAALLHSLPLQRSDKTGWQIRDGFGRAMRYRTSAETSLGRAEFVSAGPDGQFGDPAGEEREQVRAAADNIRGSDLEASDL